MVPVNSESFLDAPSPSVFFFVVAFALGFELLMCLVVGLVA